MLFRSPPPLPVPAATASPTALELLLRASDSLVGWALDSVGPCGRLTGDRDVGWGWGIFSDADARFGVVWGGGETGREFHGGLFLVFRGAGGVSSLGFRGGARRASARRKGVGGEEDERSGGKRRTGSPTETG